jgi:hypothetical protein
MDKVLLFPTTNEHGRCRQRSAEKIDGSGLPGLDRLKSSSQGGLGRNKRSELPPVPFDAFDDVRTYLARVD